MVVAHTAADHMDTGADHTADVHTAVQLIDQLLDAAIIWRVNGTSL